MNWELIFTITNNWALLMWLILAFAPRREIVMKGVFYGGVSLLALTYALIVIPLMTGMIEGGSSDGSFSSLAGVQALLSSDGGATIGWIHFLAFDLFVGMWVARNAGSIRICALDSGSHIIFRIDAGAIGSGALSAATLYAS